MFASFFLPMPQLTTICDRIWDQSNKKTENDKWVTGCHVPYGKISIKLFKNKKKLLPWGVMSLNDKELHKKCITHSKIYS